MEVEIFRYLDTWKSSVNALAVSSVDHVQNDRKQKVDDLVENCEPPKEHVNF